MELEILLRDLIKPELNKIYTEPPSSRGGGDMGLFCREHAFHCLFLSKILGYNAVIMRGDLTFTLDGYNIYTTYQSGSDHAWCQVRDAVPVDLSVNFEYYGAGVDNIDLVYGSGQRMKYLVSYTENAAEYESHIHDKTRLPRLSYLEKETVEIPLRDLLDDPHRFLIKPPRAGMAELFGKDIFSEINLHLFDLANGRTKRLTTYKDSKNTVKTIGSRYPMATEKINKILGCP
jgi:hypothetical protein